MDNRFTRFLESKTARHYARVVAFAVFGCSVGVLAMLWAYPTATRLLIEYRQSAQKNIVEVQGGATTSPYTRSAPISIRIPSIGVDAMFEAPLELNDDQTIEVPDSFEKVGWYKLGASPGEVGPAVILGHVDSYEGPAVFFSLGQLSSGDRIYITRSDGTEVEFKVDYFERYPVEEFPTEKVYGKTSGSELRLITCTGVYNHGTLRYNKNLVVYATLVSTTTIESP